MRSAVVAIWTGQRARVRELTDRRSENTSVFAMSDGGFQTEVSAGLVHYRDRSGRWQDIDRTVRAVDSRL